MTAALQWRRPVVALIVLGTVALAAQDRPDFSGRWVLAGPPPTSTDIPSTLVVRQSLVRMTAAGDPMRPFFKDITVDRQFQGRTTSETHAIGVVGGVVSGLRIDGRRAGPIGHHAVTWEGDSLVFETATAADRTPAAATWSERREVWSLQPDGRLRVTLTTGGSAEERSEVTAVYRRQ